MELTFQLTLIGCSDHVQQCFVQLLNFQSDNILSLTVFDYYLYGIHNHTDTSQLKTMLCCQLLFCEFFASLPILVMFIKLVGSSLFCIGANKGLNDFFMKKNVIFKFLLLEHCFLHRNYSLYMLWVTKSKFVVLLFLCGLLILESQIQFSLVL